MERFDDCELITAMVTPMKQDGSVDHEAVELLARHLQKNGSQGILIGGSTGEEPTLTSEEKWQVFETVKKAVTKADGTRDIKLLVGTGCPGTWATIAETKHAVNAGADAAVVIVPPQIKPNKDGQIQHYTQVANSVAGKLPIIIYNIPSRTGVNMQPETVNELAKCRNIIGIKQSYPDMKQVEQMRALCPKDFKIFSGDDDLTLAMVNRGAHGVISVASHIDAVNIKKMIDLAKSGKKAQALKLHCMMKPLFEACFVTTNPMPIKHLLAEYVAPWMTPTLRSPMVPLNPEFHAQMVAKYEQYIQNVKNTRAEADNSMGIWANNQKLY